MANAIARHYTFPGVADFLKPYLPKKVDENFNPVVEIQGEAYYNLDPCMLRLKFAQLSVTNLVTQPVMALAAIVYEIYQSVRVLFGFGCDAAAKAPFYERFITARSCYE